MLYIYINLFGWRCANLAVATQSWRGHRTWPISQRERKTYLHKFRTKHLSMATAMGKHGKTYGTIWESHYEYLWMLISMANMNQSMWNYVNICEHHENHRWTSQNPQTLVSILIPLSLSLSMFWWLFFFGDLDLGMFKGSLIQVALQSQSFISHKGRWQRRVPAWFLENICKNTIEHMCYSLRVAMVSSS